MIITKMPAAITAATASQAAFEREGEEPCLSGPIATRFVPGSGTTLPGC